MSVVLEAAAQKERPAPRKRVPAWNEMTMGKRTASKGPGASPKDRPKNDEWVREPQADPHRLAEMYLRTRRAEHKFRWSLRFWREDWWVLEGKRYRIVPESDLRAEVTWVTKNELDRWAKAVRKKSADDKEAVVAKVTTALISNVLQALKGFVLVSANLEQPMWVGRSRGRGPVLAMANGLVDLERLLARKPDVLHVHSPDWFSAVCLDYAFNLTAQCPRFLAFLGHMFEADPERLALVQEWMGYCLTTHDDFTYTLTKCSPLWIQAMGKAEALASRAATRATADRREAPWAAYVDGRRFPLGTAPNETEPDRRRAACPAEAVRAPTVGRR